jgi:hypothetical protein
MNGSLIQLPQFEEYRPTSKVHEELEGLHAVKFNPLNNTE